MRARGSSVIVAPDSVTTGAWWATSHTTPVAASAVPIPSSPRPLTAQPSTTSAPITTRPTAAAHSAAVIAATGRVPTMSRPTLRRTSISGADRERLGRRVREDPSRAGRSSMEVTRRCSHPRARSPASDTRPTGRELHLEPTSSSRRPVGSRCNSRRQPR